LQELELALRRDRLDLLDNQGGDGSALVQAEDVVWVGLECVSLDRQEQVERDPSVPRELGSGVARERG
jgi:hypothetical protein